jgi:hypothetical protein
VNSAAMLARAPDARLAKLAHGPVSVERLIECAELRVGRRGELELGLHEVGALPREAMQLDQEASEIAQLKLAQLAEVARPAAEPRACVLPPDNALFLRLTIRAAASDAIK